MFIVSRFDTEQKTSHPLAIFESHPFHSSFDSEICSKVEGLAVTLFTRFPSMKEVNYSVAKFCPRSGKVLSVGSMTFRAARTTVQAKLTSFPHLTRLV